MQRKETESSTFQAGGCWVRGRRRRAKKRLQSRRAQACRYRKSSARRQRNLMPLPPAPSLLLRRLVVLGRLAALEWLRNPNSFWCAARVQSVWSSRLLCSSWEGSRHTFMDTQNTQHTFSSKSCGARRNFCAHVRQAAGYSSPATFCLVDSMDSGSRSSPTNGTTPAKSTKSKRISGMEPPAAGANTGWDSTARTCMHATTT